MIERLSNAAEDFQAGGLYPGGSGIFTEFKYELWDYNGTQPPDSNVAVHAVFQPTDGSNENKPVIIFWNVGPAGEFSILDDGAFLGSETRKGLSDNCNWKQALDAFKKSGGLDDKLLNGAKGLLILRGTEATLTRADQKEREGFRDEAKEEPKDGKGDGRKPFKRTILVPTRCKFPWEKPGAARPVAVMPAPVAGAVAGAPGTVAALPPLPNAAANGTGTSFADVVEAILTAQGGTIDMAALPKLIVDSTPNLDRAARVAYTKLAKDEAEMNKVATEKNWTYGGGMLIK